MKDLRSRFPVFLASLAIVATLLFFAYNPWLQYVVVMAVAAMGAIAIWEYEQFAKAKGGQMIFPALLAITAVETAAFYAAARSPSFQWLPLLLFFVGFLILFALHFRQKNGAVVDLAVSLFGLVYIAVPMGMVLGVLYFPFSEASQDGRWWLVYLLTVTKITDVGAYFAGNLWGRRKLAPMISPGKTVEGAIFGLICAIGTSLVFYALNQYTHVNFPLTLIEALILGVILGVTGQFGDLSESLLKRDANKKDSNALPGLGGMLDALDSLLFNVPIIYLYLNFIRL